MKERKYVHDVVLQRGEGGVAGAVVAAERLTRRRGTLVPKMKKQHSPHT